MLEKAASRRRAGQAHRQDRARAAPVRGAGPAQAGASLQGRLPSLCAVGGQAGRVDRQAAGRRLLAARSAGSPARRRASSRASRRWRWSACARCSPTACATRASRSRSSRSSSSDLDASLAYLEGCRSCEPKAHHDRTSARPATTTATRRARSRSSSPEFTEGNEMAVKVPIFMDNHSTTPVDPRVLDAMLPYFREDFGNAASRNHVFGWTAEKAVELAREQVGALIGASGQGDRVDLGRDRVDQPRAQGRRRVLQGEGQPHHHRRRPSTRPRSTPASVSRSRAARSPICPSTTTGMITPRAGRGGDQADTTILVALMLANNEIGTIHPINEIGAAIKAQEGRALLRRRRAGRGQDAVRRQRGQGRPGGDLGAQDVRAEGRGRALRAPQAARARRRADRRRRSRARHALGHAQRAGHRRLRQGGRAVRGSRWRRGGQAADRRCATGCTPSCTRTCTEVLSQRLARSIGCRAT